MEINYSLHHLTTQLKYGMFVLDNVYTPWKAILENFPVVNLISLVIIALLAVLTELVNYGMLEVDSVLKHLEVITMRY